MTFMLNILLVDDDVTVRRAFRRVLEHAGHAVHEASTTREACDALTHHECDAAFLDVNLGEEDGVALSLQLRAIRPAMSVAFATGSKQSAERAKKHGEVLRKPCSPAQLLAVVARWSKG